MRNITDYILSYDDVLDQSFCQRLIDQFEQTKDSEHLRESKYNWTTDYRSFTELNISRDENFKWAHSQFYETSKKLASGYKKKTNSHFFPEKFGYEDARMKKYKNDGVDQFGWHVDVGDYASARRYLVIFYYLNDVECGGETIFNISDESFIHIKPRCGRIVMFPPMWMFPHIGTTPISNSKYIVSTYLHYL
jgi:hypothetical protein